MDEQVVKVGRKRGKDRIRPGDYIPGQGRTPGQQDRQDGTKDALNNPVVAAEIIKAAAALPPVALEGRGTKEAGEKAARELAGHLDRLIPPLARAAQLAELLTDATRDDEISARLAVLKYVNALSGIVTIAEDRAASAGMSLPRIVAAGAPAEDGWSPSEASAAEKGAAFTPEQRPMDGYKAPEKPATVLRGPFRVNG